jgi:hypothetical protein
VVERQPLDREVRGSNPRHDTMALLLGRHYEFPQCGIINGKLLFKKILMTAVAVYGPVMARTSASSSLKSCSSSVRVSGRPGAEPLPVSLRRSKVGVGVGVAWKVEKPPSAAERINKLIINGDTAAARGGRSGGVVVEVVMGNLGLPVPPAHLTLGPPALTSTCTCTCRCSPSAASRRTRGVRNQQQQHGADVERGADDAQVKTAGQFRKIASGDGRGVSTVSHHVHAAAREPAHT